MSKKNKRRHKFIYRNNHLEVFQPHISIIEKTTKESSQNKKNHDDDNIKNLINIALEIWKIEKKTNKLKASDGEDKIKWFEFPISKIYEILQNNWVKVIDYTWKKHIEWMNWIEIISVEKDQKQKDPIILDSINPLIEVNGQIYLKSKVIVLSS